MKHCEMMVCAPVENTHLYYFSLALPKKHFTCNTKEKNYSAHNPVLKRQCLCLVDFTVTMEMFKPMKIRSVSESKISEMARLVTPLRNEGLYHTIIRLYFTTYSTQTAKSIQRINFENVGSCSVWNYFF